MGTIKSAMIIDKEKMLYKDQSDDSKISSKQTMKGTWPMTDQQELLTKECKKLKKSENRTCIQRRGRRCEERV